MSSPPAPGPIPCSPPISPPKSRAILKHFCVQTNEHEFLMDGVKNPIRCIHYRVYRLSVLEKTTKTTYNYSRIDILEKMVQEAQKRARSMNMKQINHIGFNIWSRKTREVKSSIAFEQLFYNKKGRALGSMDKVYGALEKCGFEEDFIIKVGIMFDTRHDDKGWQT